MRQLPRKLMFNDGYVLDPTHIFIASQLQAYAKDDVSRISVIADGKWKFADLDDAVLSVACLQKERLTFFMGHNGKIFVTGRGKIEKEILPVTDKLGTLLRIRNIAEKIYVCGMSGQVYRRDENAWIEIDQGIRGLAGIDFEDIGGSSAEDIYAVGMPGIVYHFNGRQWRKLDFPTNRPLSGVKCVSKDEVYVCGNNGNLFRGSRDQWEFIGDKKIKSNFWAVEEFQNKIYVAYGAGLFVHDAAGLSKLDFADKGEIDGHRLHANGGVLWSFGINNVFCFDGSTWQRVICPKNV